MESLTILDVEELTPCDLLVQVRNGNREAAITLTRELRSGAVANALKFQMSPKGEKAGAHVHDVTTYLAICRELAKYWIRQSEWRNALVCISFAILCARPDKSRSHIDRLRHAAICYEIGWHARAIRHANSILKYAGKDLLPKHRRYLQILKCRAYEKTGDLDTARACYQEALQFAAAAHLPPPNWQPEGDRISHFSLLDQDAPGETRNAS